MYLSARTYVSGWSHSDKKEQAQFTKMLEAAGVKPDAIAPGSPHGHIELCVGYWRKANAIHGWFVKNCQGGKDECQVTDVSREDLTRLLNDCKQQLELKGKKTGDVLPPVSGFFFGSTEKDEGYWQDITDTITIIEKVLTNPALTNWELQYQASW